ncbi:hypothetical protein AB8S08_11525 [Pseudidiomarina sp. PP-1MA]|jgi:hypothetical protein|uniref:Uncharacterized protein n=1 Tax=Pseudidiomarina sp. PP-1MA TaxID=3237706 RepID=A0AB39X6L5_9GAMM
MNNKYESVEFHIHEANLVVKLLFNAGADGEFPITHNDVLDILNMIRKKLDEAGLTLEDLIREQR